MNQLFIPTKIKVGYQERTDTYTKQLAYVIYYDQKGTLRKEKSWESWRDKKIETKEFDNTPAEGFVLNKGVGGTRESYGWNTRSEYIRVYDPRGFEFEISVANLLFILRECSCSKGKGLEGKFLYAWDGTELVLVPEACEDYKSSVKYTDLQSMTVSKRAILKGRVYETKTQEKLLYIGEGRAKKLVFFDLAYNPAKAGTYGNRKYVFLTAPKSLAREVSQDTHSDFAEISKAFYDSHHYSPVKEIQVKETKSKIGDPISQGIHTDYTIIDKGGKLYLCTLKHWHREPNTDSVVFEAYLYLSIVNGQLQTLHVHDMNVGVTGSRFSIPLPKDSNKFVAFAILESGQKIKLFKDYYHQPFPYD